MTLLSDQIMERIRREKLKPKPGWHFITQRILAMLIFFVFLLIGSISAGIMIELFDQRSLLEFITHQNGANLILSGFPYVWIILLMIALGVVLIDFKVNLYGYRYQLKFLMVVFLCVVFSVGFATYSFGLSRTVENYIEQKSSVYARISQPAQTLWLQPEEGFLYGRIEKDPEGDVIMLKDEEDRTWEIEGADVKLEQEIEKIEEQPVKIIGEKTEENKFMVEKIIPEKVKGVKDEKEESSEDKDKNNEKGKRLEEVTQTEEGNRLKEEMKVESHDKEKKEKEEKDKKSKKDKSEAVVEPVKSNDVKAPGEKIEKTEEKNIGNPTPVTIGQNKDPNKEKRMLEIFRNRKIK